MAAPEQEKLVFLERKANLLLMEGRMAEAAEAFTAAGGAKNLLLAGDLFTGCLLFEKALSAYRTAGIAGPENRIGDLLFALKEFGAAAVWYGTVGNREGIRKAADALFEKGLLEMAVGFYSEAGVQNEKSRMARLALDCQSLLADFRFSDAFVAWFNAGKADLHQGPSAAAGDGPEGEELRRFLGHITRSGAPKLGPEELLQCRDYFRAEANKLLAPADGHPAVFEEIVRSELWSSRATMANLAATLLIHGW